jgi:hypothetical protein
MCCKGHHQQGLEPWGGGHSQRCGCGMHSPPFLSKTKRIEALKKHAEHLKEKAQDIENHIDELNQEK